VSSSSWHSSLEGSYSSTAPGESPYPPTPKPEWYLGNSQPSLKVCLVTTQPKLQHRQLCTNPRRWQRPPETQKEIDRGLPISFTAYDQTLLYFEWRVASHRLSCKTQYIQGSVAFTDVSYSGKFSWGSMFHGFRGELFTAKKRTREILNMCIQNILHFVPEVKQLSKKRSSINKI